MDLSRIDHQLDGDGCCRVVIETPRCSRSKYTYNPTLEAFELSGLLPAGMSFPLDFGMIPGTRGEDGDPLDILVIADEPIAVGSVVRVKLLGVIEAEQTEEGNTCRNDRLIGRAALSINYSQAERIADLGPPFVDHLGAFFINLNALKGKGFKVLRIADAGEAARLIAQGTIAGDPVPKCS